MKPVLQRESAISQCTDCRSHGAQALTPMSAKCSAALSAVFTRCFLHKPQTEHDGGRCGRVSTTCNAVSYLAFLVVRGRALQNPVLKPQGLLRSPPGRACCLRSTAWSCAAAGAYPHPSSCKPCGWKRGYPASRFGPTALLSEPLLVSTLCVFSLSFSSFHALHDRYPIARASSLTTCVHASASPPRKELARVMIVSPVCAFPKP